MPGSILGNAVRRVEDPVLLTGAGHYVGDLRIPGMLHAHFVRSPFAHAAIRSIDADAAREAPGVVAVLTGADLGIAPFISFIVVNENVKRPALAEGEVRFVGEAVAIVVAETKAAAVDAAELVDVDYDPLPAVVSPEDAVADGAPEVFPGIAGNVAAGIGDARGDAVLEGADVVVRGRFVQQRIAIAPMEGNVIAVVPGAGDGFAVTVHISTQMPHRIKDTVATVFGLEPDTVRVVAPYVGGGFGGKPSLMADHAAVIGAALHLGRPVTWAETRSENLVGMPQGRGQVQYVELGLTNEGTITGARYRVIGDAGAYAGFGGALPMGPMRAMAQGVYQIPAISYSAAAALTNTSPTGAFRGAGRPEAACALERVMDLAAAELGLDPVEVRRRNLIGPGEFPYRTRMGTTYDVGDYDLPLREAVRLAGYDDLRAEQAARRARGDRVMLGIGVSCYVEVTAGGGSKEYASVEVHPDGTATVMCGTSSHGQGHATSFAMIVADRLGIPLEDISFVQSDTSVIPTGGGTGGSRSLQVGGSAVSTAADAVLALAKDVAANLLEAGADDIVVTDDGRLGVAGVPASALSWSEIAAAFADQHGGPMLAALDFDQGGATFPFGAHVSVVEVDLDTGRVVPVRHVAVDDCGRILNPLIVEGQQHGGIAQGMAQALWEEFVYDEDGNPLTSTFAEYGMPSAAEFPPFETATTETPTPMNPLGAKGIGESGTIGSLPATHSAVVDALAHLGVRHIDMPCTPEKVWRAIQDAEAGTLPPVWRDPPAFFDGLARRAAPPRPAGADQADI